jgi:hypothetical protein
MKEWAENECRIACGRENPNYNFDSDGFDYGCDCYKSALKAYKSLMDDGHSGMSFSFTRSILTRLMEGLPLTPIQDEDFKEEENCYGELPEGLAKRGLKSDIQCSRMSSLFRKETLDGEVTYHDLNRSVCVDVENPSDLYGSGADRVVDELFPITMPYYPQPGRYKVYVQTFLTDKKNGDFDTKGILYIETPSGKKVDVNRFMTEKDGKWIDITKEEYDKLLEKRIDKLNNKIADKLLWTLISNSGSDELIEKREAAYKKKSDEDTKLYYDTLCELCKFYLNPENYKYNTFNMEQKLCKGDVADIKEQGLLDIANFLKYILNDLDYENN